ncbi:MAG TPA: hypothetical protein VKF14_21220 [Candidatus Dormibacteraeota bacterium]|nr:hypothetical protein [Candidatus Dormibacteraeota bacterium]
MRRFIVFAVAVLLPGLLPVPGLADAAASRPSSSSCRLAQGVRHVIYVQFDNTHFTRDTPNVPSDLEQMPHLLNFLESQGTLLANHHTPLIAHTATDILTSLTGLYGDRMGIPISNSFRFYRSDGSGNTLSSASFGYWTDPLSDPTRPTPPPLMAGADGRIAPAPWVPFTRAGCNVGAVSTANIALENIGSDITTVFGKNSPEAAEARANPDQAVADFEGIAIHCARSSVLCAGVNNGRPDLLPDEPGGYSGYQALFGHKNVVKGIGAISAMDGMSLPGFPGFDQMPASNTLGYVAGMQERGVPVTFAYISDAHAGHGSFPDRPFGPGEADYVAQLKQYDAAFASFFSDLQSHGINRANTLFVFTADEGDHLVAGPPSPAGCDGVHVACTYSKIGEVSANLAGLIATETGVTTSFTVHSDSAPNVYVKGQPAPNAAAARALERAAGTITAVNPYSGKTETVDNTLADQAEMKLLHTLTSDAQRNPTFTMFAKPDYFLFAGAPNCSTPCVSINPAFNWNHGDIAPEINTTWLGIVGPGVRHRGVDRKVWSDHADIRPTILALTGLRDDYVDQGRAITELMNGDEGDQDGQDLISMGAALKQIDAPVGQLSLDSLRFATRAALSGTDAADGAYVAADSKIADWTARRDALVGQMLSLLQRSGEGQGDHQHARELTRQAGALLAEVHMAAMTA